MAEYDPDPAGPREWLQRAMTAHQLGRLDEADEFYGRVLKAEPRHGQALRLRGILARERGDLGASLRLLRKAAAATPRDAEPASELALTCLAAGDLLRAEAALRDALARDPESRKALANLGALCQHRGHLAAAIGLYQRVLALAPADLEVCCNLAHTLVEAGRADEALAECEAALAQAPGQPMLLAAHGAVLAAVDRFGPAIDVLERALACNPGDDMALINLAYARARLGQTGAAIEVLRRAVQANPDNARALADLGNLLAGAGEFEAALACCEAFLRRHPGERLVLATYAYALRDAGRADAARAILDLDALIRVVDLGPPRGYAGLTAFNAALAGAVAGDPSLLTNPLSKSTRGGGQTGELDLASHPALAGLGGLLRAAVSDAIRHFSGAAWAEHPLMAWAADRWTLRVWGTVLRSGGHQVPHMHPLAWLSGVYYAQLPADMGAAAAGAGWIEFGAPPERFRVTARPEVRGIEPRAGRLVIFPSWFFHRTLPFVSADPRVSVAFDVMPLRQ